MIEQLALLLKRLTRRLPVMQQEQPTLPEHLNSPGCFCWVRVAQSIISCVVFVNDLSISPFFGHYIVCSSSHDGF